MEKPNFIGTEDSVITADGVFPLPEAWREFVGFDVKEYWKEQDREKRRQAQLEKCELDDEGLRPGESMSDYGRRKLAEHMVHEDDGLGEEFEAEMEQWENRRDS
jgi:hypothetical protein